MAIKKLKLKEEDKEKEILDQDTVDDSSKDVVQTAIDKLKEEKRKKLKEDEAELKKDDEEDLSSDDEEDLSSDDEENNDEEKLDEEDEAELKKDDEEDLSSDEEKNDDEEKLDEEDEDDSAIADIASRIKSSVKLPDSEKDEEKLDEEDEVELKKDDEEDLSSDEEKNDDEEKLDEDDNVDELNAKIISKNDLDVKDDLNALFKDNKNLSEDFKNMAKTIIESAIVSKSNEVINEALKLIKQDIKKYKTQLNESYLNKINDYTSLVVENWTKDNAKQLIEQAQYETSVSLVKGIKSLFESHNFEIPNQKVDMFNRLLEENIKLEDQINSILVENVNVNNKYKELYKNQIINEESSDLSLNQKEKLKLLSESINFSNEKDFRKQLLNVKKSYFNNKKYDNRIENNNTPVQLTEQHIVDDEIKVIVEAMNKYNRK